MTCGCLLVDLVHIQHRVEQHPERAEGLAAPFGAKTQQDDAAGLERHIEGGSFAVQILLTDQITREER